MDLHKHRFLMAPHPLTNFEIQKYYQNEPRFNGVYSGNNLHSKIKDGAYVANLDEHSDIGTHWIDLHALNNNVTYLDSFVVAHIPKEIKKFSNNKNPKGSMIKKYIFRIQAYDSVMLDTFVLNLLILSLKVKV